MLPSKCIKHLVIYVSKRSILPLSSLRQKESINQEARPEESPIILPKGFDPLSMLDQVEAMYNFSMRSAHALLPQRNEKVPVLVNLS